jgi:lipoyl(octanoyl) transferase
MRLRQPGNLTCAGALRRLKMSARFRIIDTGACDPYSNMAFDETLLHGYTQLDSPPTLRIYGWKTPSLSLGFSQDPEQVLDIEYCRQNAVPFVRRITGGGIIYHANELTYSLVCSKSDLGIPSRVVSSYKTICSFLINFYGTLGLAARFACDMSGDDRLGAPHALCFASKEKYDIVIDGKKIGGNAQKRSGQAIFQHGSIPVRIQDTASATSLSDETKTAGMSRATCLGDILTKVPSREKLSELLADSFTKTFGLKADHGRLSAEEEKVFAGLKRSKYETDEWNLYRQDNFALKEDGNARSHRTALVGQ